MTTEAVEEVKRAPWGHVSRRCDVCGKVGPRTRTRRGWLHAKCAKQVGEPKL